MAFSYVTIGSFLAAIALLIMSAIILGSANKETIGATEKKNIKNTSTILLVIASIIVLLQGYNLYLQYSSGSVGSSVSYYF
jgi:hypothetical protein